MAALEVRLCHFTFIHPRNWLFIFVFIRCRTWFSFSFLRYMFVELTSLMNSTASSTVSWRTTPALWSSSSCCPHPTQTGTSKMYRSPAFPTSPSHPLAWTVEEQVKTQWKTGAIGEKCVWILYSSASLSTLKLLVVCDTDSPPLYHNPLPLSPLKCSTCAQSMPLIYCLLWSGGLYEVGVEKHYLVTQGLNHRAKKSSSFKGSLICAGHIRVFQVTQSIANQRMRPIGHAQRMCWLAV